MRRGGTGWVAVTSASVMRRAGELSLAGALVLAAACGAGGDRGTDAEAPADDPAAATDPRGPDDPADPGDPVTLRMGSPYADEERRYTPAVFRFLDRVEELSGGDVRVQMIYNDADGPFSNRPDGEQAVVRAVAGGDIDLAWAGTRVFDTLGVTSFQALHAPLLVDRYGLQAAIIESDIPGRMLAGLDEIGVVGLEVLAGGLRKPVGVAGPLLGPEDYAGITFQLYRSQVQADAVAALGATPTEVVAGVRDTGLASGEIDGHEHTLHTYVVRDNAAHAPYLTANVNLWPETTALIANPDSLAALSDTQAGWLRRAAADAAAASADLHDVDGQRAGEACAQGARFAEASEAELAALRDAVQPVYAELARDHETAAFIAEIEDLAATVPPEPLAIPEGCAVPTGDAGREP